MDLIWEFQQSLLSKKMWSYIFFKPKLLLTKNLHDFSKIPGFPNELFNSIYGIRIGFTRMATGFGILIEFFGFPSHEDFNAEC